VATDLGDLDGDGDLDWIMSAFSGGAWTMHMNGGAGTFTTETTFIASQNPACALLFDFDGDQDLDIALLDEIADEVVLWENTSPGASFCPATPNSTGLSAAVSYTGSLSVAENDLRLHVGPMPDGFGFFFYGQSTQPGTPVGNGVLCLGSQLFRSAPAQATGNLLSAPFDHGVIRTTGDGLSRFFDIQNQRFTHITCSDCGYTEFFKKTVSTADSVLDLFLGG
ncbi:zinc ribbon domain-containing protein, partial [bacterium]|nr:zinc ribbon domain-containing protein [bacterium]